MAFKFAPEVTVNQEIKIRWYHENLVGSDELLICIGDSWTWGDSLKENPENYRTDHIYGALLAKQLNTDFINMARCGCSNIEMHDWALWILPRVSEYKKVYLVITLTENGRELIFDPIWTDQCSTPETLDKFHREYEYYMFRSFQQGLGEFANLETAIGRNFTYSHKENLKFAPGHLDKTWVDILAENQTIEDYSYSPTLRLLSQMALNPLIRYFKKIDLYNDFKLEFFDTFVGMEEPIEWFGQSKFNSKDATRHPTEQGHELWAEYLYQQLSHK